MDSKKWFRDFKGIKYNRGYQMKEKELLKEHEEICEKIEHLNAEAFRIEKELKILRINKNERRFKE